MGTRCYLKSASEEQLSILRGEPNLIYAFFGDEAEEGDPPVPEGFLEQTGGMETDLDKTWHGLHFLFTGTDEEGDLPAAFLFKGGTELEPFGARAVSFPDARQYKEFLYSLSEDELRSRFDPDRMTELDLYPDHIWKRNPADTLSYLLEYFEVLRTFTRDVVAEGLGLVIWIV
ncbi:MAG TPA: YfbM family protein [Thermoanaerobaculia bacterium]|nr:YfbM family protein [Thermoanaerobaculia bacterium]